MPNYDKLPIFPLHAVLFPYMSLPLHIFEERYRLMIERCVEQSAPFGVVLLQSGTEVDQRDDKTPLLCTIGTLARIERCERLDDGRFFVQARGDVRFEIDEVYSDEPYLTARVRPLWEQGDDPLDVQPVFDQASDLFRGYIEALVVDEHKHLGALQLPQDPGLLSYAIAASLQVTLSEKQKLLEAVTVRDRLQCEVEALQAECETLDYFAGNGSDFGEDEGARSGADQNSQRTILRVDPSYTQYLFSRN